MLTFTVIAQPDDASLSDSVLTVPEQGGDIGRSDDCKIFLPDSSRRISRRHAELVNQSGHFFIRDWSSNGLQINGESISRGVEGQQLLKDGDILSIGRYRLMVSQLNESREGPKSAEKREDVSEGETPSRSPTEYIPTSSSEGQQHDSSLVSYTTSPPLLTDAVNMKSDKNISHNIETESSFLTVTPASAMGRASLTSSSHQHFLSQSSYRAGVNENLVGMNALADEILKEFDPEHLQHVLRPWRKRFLHRASWWSLYCRYFQQIQRTGELHTKIREWSLRSGGLGRGGS